MFRILRLPVLAFALASGAVYGEESAPADRPVRLGEPPVGLPGGLCHTRFAAGGIVAAGMTGGLHVWSPDAGWVHRDLFPEGSTGTVTFAVSADGRTIAAVDAGPSIRLWNGETLKARGGIPDTCAASFLALSRDGSLLAAEDEDGRITLYATATGAVLRRFSHPSEPWGVELSPDGTLAVTTGHESPMILWNAATGEELARFGDPRDPPRVPVFSPDGKRLAAVVGTVTLAVWDVATRQEAARWEAEVNIVDFCLFSVDGSELISFGSACEEMDGPYFGRVEVWEAATGASRRRATGRMPTFSGAALSLDGKTLAAVGEQNALFLLHAEDLRRFDPTPGHEGAIESLRWSADGRTLASVSADGTARLWDVGARREKLTTVADGACVPIAALSPDGALLAIASCGPGVVRLVEVSTGKPARELRFGWDHVAVTEFSPDGLRLAACGADGRLCVADVADGHEVFAVEDKAEISSAAFSPDGRFLALRAGESRVKLRDARTGAFLRSLDTNRDGPPTCIAWSPDGRTVVSSADDIVTVSEVASGEILNTIFSSEVRSLSISSDGRLLAVGRAEDEEAALYSLATGLSLRALGGHRDGATAVAFSPDGRTLATGGGDGSVFLWDVGALGLDPAAVLPPPAWDVWQEGWEKLGSADPSEAGAACWGLVAAPEDGVLNIGSAWVRRSRPRATPELRALVEALDAEDPAARQKALRDLRAKSDDAEGALLEAQRARKLSPDALSQVDSLLARMDLPFTRNPTRLRLLRAIGVLEAVASEDAVAVLREMAEEKRPRRQRAAAQAALDRLEARGRRK